MDVLSAPRVGDGLNEGYDQVTPNILGAPYRLRTRLGTVDQHHSHEPGGDIKVDLRSLETLCCGLEEWSPRFRARDWRRWLRRDRVR